ncbi:alpha/beta hydrolase [Kitasatospora sp. NBC_01287]|uniref:alpha/beta hydrolase n=1 Tax=Kitasatospora sp. NBC_01287 TaxID=2903573 RepID=UPI0022542176|nr:alpha/beta hydrolase [Kitasatospora sp. NBC_01287]MCX4749333.1 alpha/beta hydrolase [Kitasatospora sp. NBC_01287]
MTASDGAVTVVASGIRRTQAIVTQTVVTQAVVTQTVVTQTVGIEAVGAEAVGTRPFGGRLMIVLDEPSARPARGLVVCAHGLTGDRTGPVRLLADWSAALARAGWAVARLDLRGSGDSSGTFEEATLAQGVEDVLGATAWSRGAVAGTRGRPLPTVLAGISLGGLPAVGAAASVDPLAGVLLLSSDLLEAEHFAGAPTLFRDGEFHLSTAYLAERAALRPRAALASIGAPVRLVHGMDDPFVAPEVPALLELGISARGIPRCGHLFETPAARARLVELSLGFLRECVPEALERPARRPGSG